MSRPSRARLNNDLVHLAQMVFDAPEPPPQSALRPVLLAIDTHVAELMRALDKLPSDAWAHVSPFRTQEDIMRDLRDICGVFRAAASLAEFEVETGPVGPRKGRYLQGRKIDARLRTFAVHLVGLFEKYTGMTSVFKRPVEGNEGSLVVQFALRVYCHFLPPNESPKQEALIALVSAATDLENAPPRRKRKKKQ